MDRCRAPGAQSGSPAETAGGDAGMEHATRSVRMRARRAARAARERLPRNIHTEMGRRTRHARRKTVPRAAVALVLHSLMKYEPSEPTRQAEISYAVFCLKKKKTLLATKIMLYLLYKIAYHHH
eukprot:NODE_27107_length_525_cov_6.442211.p2 GENE.NODE_27107_length_525_cov_6.442211~~NODE_27107_length_525_cov_6.442211.p2  ORF type:complete len:124 (-),score=15.58 NODE_27107_length_525_cov_6.442211:47-418(-)